MPDKTLDIYKFSSQVKEFFHCMRKSFLSPAYEDIRLVPDYSDLHPRDISLKTQLTREIELNVPIVSAAMDTVTEADAAICMARCGGIGILHKNFHLDPHLDMQAQVKAVARVKHHLHARIQTPVGFPKDMTLGALIDKKDQNGYNFDTFIVYENGGRLAGLITRAVLKYNRYLNRNSRLEEVMIREVVTANNKTSLQEAYDIMLEKKIGNIVLVDDDNKVNGMYTFKDVENVIHNLNKDFTTDPEGRLRVGAAVGVNDMQRVQALVDEKVDVIVLDSAHGDSIGVVEAVERYKKEFPQLQLIAGNISTAEAAERLIKAGADAVKVGQGPGQICSTRIVSGIGVMQPDAVYRAASAANRHGVPVIADGGIRYSGDIPIALAAGASTVMMGQALAGCKESPGELLHEDGKLFKIYRGMASVEAMSVKGGSDRYQKEAKDLKKLVPEGITKKLPYKGNLGDQIFMLAEGAKTGFGYCGARDMASFKERAQLHRITAGGVRESHPDSRGMVHTPPNYSRP